MTGAIRAQMAERAVADMHRIELPLRQGYATPTCRRSPDTVSSRCAAKAKAKSLAVGGWPVQMLARTFNIIKAEIGCTPSPPTRR